MKTSVKTAYLSILVVLLATLSSQSLHAQASLSLNGVNQYVLVPPNTNFTPTNLTFEAWVYPTNASCNTILSRGDGGVNNLTDYILNVGYDGTNCGTMTVGFYAAGAWNASSNTVALNTWTHVAVTYDGTNKQFYINGVLNRTAVRTNSLYSSPGSPLLIGMQGTNCACNFFNGQLAEVRLWNTVRTASQIQSDLHYSSGAQTGLVAYYHLDEGSGPSAYDDSGNGNTGALEGGASWSSLTPPLGQLVVANTADSGPGTLRAAIADATSGELITFAPNLSGAHIPVNSALTINKSLRIDASALPGGILLFSFAPVYVFNTSSSFVSLDSLTINNGFTSLGIGRGITNSGVLVLNNCTVSGNTSGPGNGGGIVNSGTLELTRCTVSGNTSGPNAGGGIYNSGVLTMNGCTVSGNSAGSTGPGQNAWGGGIFNGPGGSATLTQCTVSGNSANLGGGGIYNNNSLTLNQCTVSGNSAGPGQTGGGIFNDVSNSVMLTPGGSNSLLLNQCTVVNNSAQSGGGIATRGAAALNGCTVFGNTVSTLGNGGGIYNFTTNNIYSSSIITLKNSIVADNLAGGVLQDIANVSPNPGGVSLFYGSTNLVQSVVNQGGNVIGPAPLSNAPYLLELRNYGGPTQTMPPGPGSPAIGAGSVAANTDPTDQRGYPRTQNGLIDLGAVELPIVQPFTVNPTNGWAPLTVQFASTNVDSDGSTIVGWTWNFGDGNASSLQNPTNIYGTAGPFSPGLTVMNSLGLELSVSGPAISVYQPLALAGVSLSGTNLTLSGSNGVSGLVYTVLTSTNLNLPLNQWTPLVTNTWSTNGPFSLILTNVLNPSVPRQFYRFGTP